VAQQPLLPETIQILFKLLLDCIYSIEP